MHKKLDPLQIAAIALLAAFTVFITWRAKVVETRLVEERSSNGMTNKPAPDFSLDSLDGRTVSLADYKGRQKLVLAYWASWCGPCKLEMPSLKRFYENYHRQDSDFEVLAISIDENEAAARAYAKDAKLPFPVLLDPESKAADAFSVDAIPTMFVIARSGKIIYASTGLDQALEFRLAIQLGITIHSPQVGAGRASGH